MNKTFKNALLPVGLLLMSGRFIVSQLVKVPDFINGFLMGLGITLVVGALFLSKHKNKSL